MQNPQARFVTTLPRPFIHATAPLHMPPFVCPEPIGDGSPVLVYHPCYPFEGFDLGTYGYKGLSTQETGRPSSKSLGSKLLELLFERNCPPVRMILRPLDERPTRVLESLSLARTRARVCFAGMKLVEGRGEVDHDVKTVQDAERFLGRTV